MNQSPTFSLLISNKILHFLQLFSFISSTLTQILVEAWYNHISLIPQMFKTNPLNTKHLISIEEALFLRCLGKQKE
jgi:hypothetical protein